MDQEKRVQLIGQMAGFDWTKAWAVIQRISPQLQEILMVILEEFGNEPHIVGATIPNTQVSEVTYGDCQAAIEANKAGLSDLDPATLLALLQVVGPVLSKMILALLSKLNKATPPTNQPATPPTNQPAPA